MQTVLVLLVSLVAVSAESGYEKVPIIVNDPPRPPPPPPPKVDEEHLSVIVNDPPKPPPPPPPTHDEEHLSVIVNDPPKPPPPPPPTHGANPEALNRHYTEDGHRLWEGDMVLTKDQADYLYGPVNTRKAINDINKRWTNNNVPFAISQSSQQDRNAILAGLQHWVDNSCITFTEVPLGYGRPHLIFKKLEGCYSSVGMQSKHGQDISIGQNCEGMGTIAHEVGHALGFYHEQSRPDRGNFVKLLNQNINQTMKHNFNLQPDIDSLGVPYDLGSLMHYGLDYFTVNGHNTMVPLNIHDTFKIGQRDGLSFYDLKLANIMYKCAANCQSRPNCQNGGFVDHRCSCRCPTGFTGQLCQSRVNLPATCGRDYNSPATITTPNFPNNYPKGSRCVWFFQAPAGRRVRATFPQFDVLQRHKPSGTCPWDFVEIRTNNMDDGDKFCEKELNMKEVTSGTNQMALLFKADYEYSSGFQAQVTFV